jgi:hypothetical protein
MLFINAVPNAGVSRVKQDERNHFDVPSNCFLKEVTKIKLKFFENNI